MNAADRFAMALGYALLIGLGLGLLVFGAVSLFDSLDDRPQEAWPQVQALLDWIDGGAR